MLLTSIFLLTLLTPNTPAFTDDNDCPKKYVACGNGKCVSNVWRCDGDNECGNWEDEKDCDKLKPQRCGSTDYECDTGDCIPLRWACDGEHDCMDGSDETKCDNSSCDGFQCKDNHCLPIRWRCDGQKDCPSGEDEELCHQSSSHLCDSDEFSCSSGSCLSMDKVCDGKNDCSDGSDEGNHCIDKCANTSCHHGCKPSPLGIRCFCNEGYELSPDNKTCLDVNECKKDGFCSHRCKNIPGSFRCSCLDGYELQNRSCFAQGAEPLLVFSTYKEIRGMYLRSGEYFPIHKANIRSTAIDVDPTQSRLYWTELSAESSLYSTGIDGRGTKTVVGNGLVSPEDLAIDYVAGNIYITDSDLRKVLVCRIDGSVCATLHKTNVYKPRSLALDLPEGLLYWSDWGEKQSIQRSNLDGTRRTVLVSTDVAWPNGIVIDHTSNRLYWCDAQLNRIEFITLDGKVRKTVLQEDQFHPYSITVFEDKLYYSDWTTFTLKSCNKFTGHDQEVVTRENDKRIMGVHVYHPVLAKRIKNPCMMSTCSHVCVISQFGKHRCLCPSSFVLLDDQKTCTMDVKADHLFIADKSDVYHMQSEGVGQDLMTRLAVSHLENAGAIAYNCMGKQLFVSDTKKNVIFEVNVTNFKKRDLVVNHLKGVYSLAYDWLGKNLYWADAAKGTIEVYSTLNRNRSVLLSNLSRPIAIALVPDKGIMFVSEVGSDRPKVDMYDMDGKNKKAMPFVSGATVSLALHPSKPWIFWSDQHTRTISSLDYSKSDKTKKVLKRDVPRVTSIAVGENFLYWMELASHKVSMMSLHSNTSKTHLVTLPGDRSEITIGKIIFARPPTNKASSACQVNNGGCSHVCVVNPTGHSCACSEAMQLTSDKKTCKSKKECDESDFKCKSNGLCLPQDFICDGISNCDDGSDELNCERWKCPSGEFQCTNGHCIVSSYKCDSSDDCGDGSDELGCPNITCAKNKFPCGNGQCIPDLWRCDAEKDCANGHDEEHCSRNSCKKDQMKCGNGQCIPVGWMCDGTNDCRDNSDESKEKCGTTSAPCLSDDFRCSNGDCIDHKLLCDHRNDCPDNSDEMNCVYNDTCKKEKFRCNDGTCIYLSEVCDGYVDCDNDETQNCTKSVCSKTEFYCSYPTNRCIPETWLCDGHNDCDDGADEKLLMCPVKPTTTIINLAAACDEFICKSGECLPWKKVCDEIPDCSDYSDEGGICISSCGRGNGGCSHLCTPTPEGPKCSCPVGYELQDGKACYDINECGILGSCSHFCINTRGSFKCSCADGYFQALEHKKCKADGGIASLVYLLPDQIRGLDLHTHTQRVYINQEHTDMRGLDYDAEDEYFFWSDWKEGTVNQFDIVNRRSTVLVKNLNRPYFLKWDWIAKNLFISTGDGSIVACTGTGEFCTDVLTSTFRHISSIEISPGSSYLFWSVWSDARKTGLGLIERSNMDGTGRTRIVSERTYWPSSLAVDHVLNSVYWTDVKTNVIEAIDFHGRNRRLVVKDGISFPFSMTVFEDDVYWANWGTDQFFRSNKFALGEKVLLHIGDVKSESITIVHKARQPQRINLCIKRCQQLCLPKHDTYSCLCDKKFQLRNGTCIRKEVIQKRMSHAPLPPPSSTTAPKVSSTTVPTPLPVVAQCDDSFCLNDGECYMNGPDRRCRCHSSFFGMHCEKGKSSEIPYDYSWVVALFLGLASIALIVMVFLVCRQNRSKLTKFSDTLAVTFRNPPKVFRKKSGLVLDTDDGAGADELMLGKKGAYVQSGFGNPVFNQTPLMDVSPEGEFKRWPSYDSEDSAFASELQSHEDSKFRIKTSTSQTINASKDRIVQFFKRM